MLARRDEIGDLASDFDALLSEQQQGVEALRNSTRLLHNVVEHVPVAIQLKEIADDYRFTIWNKAAETMWGLTKERVIGRNVLDGWTSADTARFREADLRAVAANGQEFTHRAVPTTDRGQRVAHMRKVPIFDETGTATHLLVIAEDITDQLAANDKLAQSEARLRGAAESALDAFFVLDCVRDADGTIADFRFRYLNAIAERLIARPDGQAVGKLLCEEFPTQRTDGHFDKYSAVVVTGVGLDEEFAIAADGVSATWLHHQVVRVGDGIAITTRDVSARKADEAELRNNRAFLQSLIENLPVAVYVKDVRPATFGKMVVWNHGAAVIAGVSAEQAIGQLDNDIFEPGVYAGIKVHDRALLETRAVRDIAEHPFRRHDGSLVYLHTVSVPLFGVDGNPEYILRISEDVTARREAEHALAASESRLRTITDTMPALIAYIDRDEIYRFANAAFDRNFASPAQSIRGRSVADVLGPAEYLTVQPYLLRVLAGERVTFEREHVGATGSVWVEATYIPERDAKRGQVVGFHAMVLDITLQRDEAERLLRLSQVDSLTGVANRVGFEQALADAMRGCLNLKQMVAVMYIDLDHFKQVNDTHGHATGDALLIAIAQRLRACLRTTDVVARLGGDEFAVVLTAVPDSRVVEKLAAKVLKEVERPVVLPSHGALAVTASIGIAVYAGGPVSVDQLVAQADAMLYVAKNAGRNGYRIAPRGPIDVGDSAVPAT